MITVHKDLKEKYNSQYSDKTEEWRRIGAIGKVENIIDVIKGIEFDTVIDVGAGDGNVLSLLSERLINTKFTAAEISDSALEQIKKKNIKRLVEVKQFDGYNLPFADKSFNLAICSHVIEHVEFPRKLLREIKRISQSQIFEIPIDYSTNVDKKFKHFNSYGHINIYTPSLFNFLLFSEGFEIVNHKNALYKKEVIRYQNSKITPNYIKILIKRFIWNVIPIFMRIKPNTYTVLTK